MKKPRTPAKKASAQSMLKEIYGGRAGERAIAAERRIMKLLLFPSTDWRVLYAKEKARLLRSREVNAALRETLSVTELDLETLITCVKRLRAALMRLRDCQPQNAPTIEVADAWNEAMQETHIALANTQKRHWHEGEP